MATRTLTVAAVATAGLLALGGGTALAVGGSDRPAVPVSLSAAGSSAADGTPTAAPGIDLATAERIALDRVGGGRITDRTERDDDDDRDVWEVEVTRDSTEHDLDVDAVTGEVVEHDTDGRDDDRDDRDD